MKVIKSLNSNDKWVTFKQIVEKECPACGYDRGVLVFSDYASAGEITCNNPECRETIEEI